MTGTESAVTSRGQGKELSGLMDAPVTITRLLVSNKADGSCQLPGAPASPMLQYLPSGNRITWNGLKNGEPCDDGDREPDRTSRPWTGGRDGAGEPVGATRDAWRPDGILPHARRQHRGGR